MARLSHECRIAFLEQCLHRILEQRVKTSNFFKFLVSKEYKITNIFLFQVISKSFLATSRSKHSKVFRILYCAGKNDIQHICVLPYLDHNPSPFSWFQIRYNDCLKLFRFLQPLLLELQFIGTYSLQCLDKYGELIESITGELIFNVRF
jgi:hypothetical protein